uniref:THAP domain-containing protein 1 n=1 Tax=Gouania willdenowi TaxID=441366 RepID=A0A8C5HUM5_GOUWI
SGVWKDKLKCSVVGCSNPHASLHRLPASEPFRSAWLSFIFHGNVPTSVGKVIIVCAKHFKDDCFCNLRQYKEGFAERLRLIEGSIPSIFGDDEESKKCDDKTSLSLFC